MVNSRFTTSIIALLIVCLLPKLAHAQRKTKSTTKSASVLASDSLFNALRWRNIGPFRAGRALGVSGHPSQPLTYYFGATGGGVWKTIDGGETG